MTEVTGRAGDIAFLLPALIHGLCATYLLMEKVQLEHMDDNYSSVEEVMPIVLAKYCTVYSLAIQIPIETIVKVPQTELLIA